MTHVMLMATPYRIVSRNLRFLIPLCGFRNLIYILRALGISTVSPSLPQFDERESDAVDKPCSERRVSEIVVQRYTNMEAGSERS